jgi:hypothetical protein
MFQAQQSKKEERGMYYNEIWLNFWPPPHRKKQELKKKKKIFILDLRDRLSAKSKDMFY